MTEHRAREVIPGGEQPAPWFEHLLPVAKFLVEERGHRALENPEEYGYVDTLDGNKFYFTRRITDEDWEAIKERFVVPDNIGFFRGLLRDNANHVDMIGYDPIRSHGQEIPIEEWEARQKP